MKIVSKLIASAAVCVLAFSLVGCAGDSTPQEEKEYTTQEISAQDVEVTGQGYSVASDGTVNYAFMINNPNEGYVAQNLTFTIEGYSADDMMLIGGGETVAEVYPGVETAVAGISYISDPDTEIARFEITPLMETVTWEKTDMTADEVKDMFSVGGIETTRQDDGTLVVSATVSTDLGKDKEENANEPAAPTDLIEAHAVCILRDDSGNILCGGYTNGFMMDQSMVDPTGATNPDAEGEPGDGQEAAPPSTGETTGSQMASTTVSMTITGAPNFASCDVYVFPGM